LLAHDDVRGCECSIEAGSLGRRKVVVDPKQRLRRPFSTGSLFQSMLDLNFEPEDAPYTWEVEGVTYTC
jgi:hypothetical protein